MLPLYPRRKNPFLASGYKELPPLTPDDLRRYFAETPDLNIGMHTGGDLLVIDVDEKPGKLSGSKALAALEAIYGPLPPTLTSITGGGGRQLFFCLPPGYGPFGDRLPVVAEWLRSHPEADSAGVIDIRNDGLIVLPPSIHPEGPRYRWEDPDLPIATLPLVWCQTPPDYAERPTRRRRQGPHKYFKTPKDLDRRDAIAHERLANVDADALLGKDALLLLANGDPDDSDPSHIMWRIILGAASVRIAPDVLWERMLASPLGEGLLRKHGRNWFNANVFEAHQHLAENILAVEEIRADYEEYEWASTEIDPGRRVSGEVMEEVFHEVLDIAVRQASLEPICDKHKIAKAIGCSRMTVSRAFKGLAILGRLEVVPEPGKPFDWPVKYRLLPVADSAVRPDAGGMLASVRSDPPTPAHAITAVSYSTPLSSLIPSTVSRSNQEWFVQEEGLNDLLRESRDALPPATGENAAEVLLNFEDPPEPPRTKKRADPWRTNTCRKCREPTLTMRDADDPDRVFRVDAQPSPIGHWIVVDDHWQILQGKGRTDHERNHDETGQSYYAWHNCSAPPQQSAQPTAVTTEPSCNSKKWTR